MSAFPKNQKLQFKFSTANSPTKATEPTKATKLTEPTKPTKSTKPTAEPTGPR